MASNYMVCRRELAKADEQIEKRDELIGTLKLHRGLALFGFVVVLILGIIF